MIVKEKVCAGWDGNSHPAFLWKRIKGKGYCKECSYKVENKKTSIKQISEKQKEKNITKKEDTKILHNWFNSLWETLPSNRSCTICDVAITGENLSVYWDHLVEKSRYPQFALDKENICFCCATCHAMKTGGKPRPKHKELIEQFKLKHNL